MAYINIANFRYGLDTRRSELTSLLGTLEVLNNAHITQGGEVEKRKAFVATALPAGTFGLEDTDVGLITFGSAADPGGWPIGNVVAYQRLQHPAVLAGAGYNAAFHLMSSVVFSTPFKGKAFVAAKFADGRTFLYYDGTLVAHSANGQVLPGFANQLAINTAQATDLSNEVNQISSWVGRTSALQPPLAGTNFYGVYAYSPPATTFASQITKSTVAGSLISWDYSAAGTGSVGAQGTASFTIAGAAGSSYSSIKASAVLGSTVLVNLMGVGILWAVDNNTTAAAIATEINNQTALTGFTATVVGATVTVKNPLLTLTSFVSPVPPPGYNWGNLNVTAVNDATANGNHAFSASLYAFPDAGDIQGLPFADAWLVGDTWTVTITTNAGISYTLGKGNISGSSPTACLVDNNRIFLSNGNQFNFSAVGNVTLWETQNTGAGFIPYTSQYGAVDTVNGFSDYQGRLAVLGRRSIQIWVTNADPAAFSLAQTLENIGTMAGLSVQALGELDVFFLSDTGVRSLRVRDSSLNAFVNDLGSPIDSLVQAALLASSDSTKAAACAIVEPTQNRYWLFLNGVIYVLSYFPSNKIAAWSTYDASYQDDSVVAPDSANYYGSENNVTLVLIPGESYTWTPGPHESTTWDTSGYEFNLTTARTFIAQGDGEYSAHGAGLPGGSYTGTMTHNGQAVFVPQKFVVHQNQVYARDASKIYRYGGADNNTYDNSIATLQLPFLAVGAKAEKAGTVATAKGIDAVFSGQWIISGCMDWVDQTFEVLYPASTPTYDKGRIPFESKGTHFSLKAVSSAASAAVLSSLMFHFEEGEETA